MERRYLENADYVKGAASEAERRKLRSIIKFFETYGSKYNVDFLLMAAQGYQESRLDQSVRSRVGAIGVMQVMPATGKDLAVGDIRKVEPNIHAGVKYFRFMMDQYYKDEPMDEVNKGLMTLASYNAGPARIRQLRREAEASRPQSERLVRQRRARRVGAHRARDGAVREQHLQVLRGLQARPRPRTGAVEGARVGCEGRRRALSQSIPSWNYAGSRNG